MRDLHIHIHIDPNAPESSSVATEAAETPRSSSPSSSSVTTEETGVQTNNPIISLDQFMRQGPMATLLEQMMRRSGTETADISFTFEPLFSPPLVTRGGGIGLRDLQRATECIISRTDEEEQDTICSICRCNLVPGEIARRILHCHHVFHQRCLDDWLVVNATCPMCRTNLATREYQV